MPQLVKGGKYTFGWSKVSDSGRMYIPEEARLEYGFKPFDKIIIINGSTTSKGFAITKASMIQNSPIYQNLTKYKELVDFKELTIGYIRDKKRIYTWSEVDRQGYFKIKSDILIQYHVEINNKLLVIRGSGFALGFIKTGPIVIEARKHPELVAYS